jgi:hypothetical protein
MRSDRFSLFRRGSVCYTQSYNRAPRKYLPARSTRESHRSAALLVVSEWLRDGVPVPRRGVRRLPELLDLNLVLSMVRPQGAELIVAALQDLRLRTRGTRPLRWKHLSRDGPKSFGDSFQANKLSTVQDTARKLDVSPGKAFVWRRNFINQEALSVHAATCYIAEAPRKRARRRNNATTIFDKVMDPLNEVQYEL